MDDQSESVKEIATAIAKSQLEMHNPGLDSSNPFYKTKYASLAAIRDAAIPILAKHGIATLQLLSTEGYVVTCTTRLIHTSGEWIQSVFSLKAIKEDPQGMGGVATYARRYSLQAIAGIVGDEDLDGNEHVKDKKDEKPKMPQSKSEVKPMPDEMKKAFNNAITGEEIHEVITPVIKITVNKGKNKTTGVDFELYKLLGNDGIIYTTFDKAIADNAKSIKATEESTGETFLFKIKHEGGQYNRIKSIDIVEPPKPSLDADDDFNDVADAAMKEVEEAGMGRG